MTYLVMNIGCIECGVSSKIVGLFADRARADAVLCRTAQAGGLLGAVPRKRHEDQIHRVRPSHG